ncbi:MAG: hypothetical protein WAO58_05945 [Fimbriimonadaceae bacterium]
MDLCRKLKQIQLSDEELLKPSWRGFFRSFARHLISPPVIATILAILSTPWWVSAELYLFLRSFTVAPSGVFAWGFILSLAVCALLATVFEFREIIRLGNRVRELRQAMKASEPGARERLLDAKRDSMRRYLWHALLWEIALLLVIAPAASLVIWSDMQRPEYRRFQGDVLPLSPELRLDWTLKRMEENGIFAPL